MVDIAKRLSELDVLLDYMDDNDWLKIPDEVIFYIKNNKDKQYVWKYDESKSFEEQEINEDTFAILTSLIIKYVANEEEKVQIKQLLTENTNDKKQEFNINDMLNHDISTNELEKKYVDKTQSLIKTNEKVSIFAKFVNLLKRIFSK